MWYQVSECCCCSHVVSVWVLISGCKSLANCRFLRESLSLVPSLSLSPSLSPSLSGVKKEMAEAMRGMTADQKAAYVKTLASMDTDEQREFMVRFVHVFVKVKLSR